MDRGRAQRVLELAVTHGDGLAGLDTEIAPAVRYLTEHDRAAAYRLVGALPSYWEDSGRVDEGRALTEEALDGHALAAASDRDVAASVPGALLAASELAFRQGDQEAARRRALDTIRAAMLIEDRTTAALAHTSLARVAYRDGDSQQIDEHARKALELAGDDPLARRGALHMLAWAAHTAGDLDEAERRFEASLAYRRSVNAGPVSIASEIANLGDLAAERGDLPRAAALLAEALQMGLEANSTYMVVNTMPSLAVLGVRAGLDHQAARLFGAGHALSQVAGLVPDPNSSIDDAEATARERLGEARYAELLSEGTMLDSRAAVELALSVADRIRVSGHGAPDVQGMG